MPTTPVNETIQATISNNNNVIPPNGWSLGPYPQGGSQLYFDAWLRLRHNNSLTITQHPIETGAAITDHFYINPSKFSFDIGMTDTTSGQVIGQFGGPGTRSINAYNTVLLMQQGGYFLTLISKYNTWNNILIESIDVSDDYRTVNASIMTVNLVQVIVVNTQVVAVSASPQVTNQTSSGQTSVSTPSFNTQLLNAVLGIS